MNQIRFHGLVARIFKLLKEEIIRLKEASPEDTLSLLYIVPDPFARGDLAQAAFGVESDQTYVYGLDYVTKDAIQQIFDIENATEKMGVIEVKDRFLSGPVIFVIEWLETVHPREDEYEAMRELLRQQMAMARHRESWKFWIPMLSLPPP